MIDKPLNVPGRALYITYSAQTTSGVMVGRLVLDNCRSPTTLDEIKSVEDFAAGTVDLKHKAHQLFLTWWQELEMPA